MQMTEEALDTAHGTELQVALQVLTILLRNARRPQPKYTTVKLTNQPAHLPPGGDWQP